MTGFGFVAAVSGDNILGGLPGSSGQGTGLTELSITYTFTFHGSRSLFLQRLWYTQHGGEKGTPS